MNWYLDACHSGSCKDETDRWMFEERDCNLKEKIDGKWKIIKENGEGGEIERYSLDSSDSKLYYLNRDAYLKFKIYMSCNA